MQYGSPKKIGCIHGKIWPKRGENRESGGEKRKI